MGAIRFELVRKDSKNLTAIKLVTYNRKIGSFVCGTGVSIVPNEWDFKTMRPKIPGPITVRLNKLESEFIKSVNYFDYNKIFYDKEKLKSRLKNIINGTPEKNNSNLLYIFVSDYIEKCKEGKITNLNGVEFSVNTIKSYQTFLSHWKRFGASDVNFDQIDMQVYNSFIKYFNDQNRLLNTIGCNIKILNKFMQLAYDQNLHTNKSYQKFRAFKIDVDDVFLNDAEINRLHQLDLSGSFLKDYLNVWLIGYYSLQRVSDFSRLSPEFKYTTAQGNQAIRYFDQKIGGLVILPLQKPLKVLLDDYGWNPPKLKSQKLNSYIKAICKLAEINQPVQYIEHRGGKKLMKSKLKNEMVENHTARRSGATNLFLAGVDLFLIQKLLGHKKIETTQKYIKASKEQIADRIAQHPRFKL